MTAASCWRLGRGVGQRGVEPEVLHVPYLCDGMFGKAISAFAAAAAAEEAEVVWRGTGAGAGVVAC